MTSYEEGHIAGFVGIGRDKNPYRKGIPNTVPEVERHVADWEAGYTAGEKRDTFDNTRTLGEI